MRLIDADALKEKLSTMTMTITGVRSGVGVLREFLTKYREIVLRTIDEAPTINAEPLRHGRWEYTKKHLWHKEDGKIDMWYLDCGYHNGPGCEVCGVSVCEHCEPDWEEMECEYGHYICSVCGEPQKTHDLNYCPNCGAKMDAKEE